MITSYHWKTLLIIDGLSLVIKSVRCYPKLLSVYPLLTITISPHEKPLLLAIPCHLLWHGICRQDAGTCKVMTLRKLDAGAIGIYQQRHIVVKNSWLILSVYVGQSARWSLLIIDGNPLSLIQWIHIWYNFVKGQSTYLPFRTESLSASKNGFSTWVSR